MRMYRVIYDAINDVTDAMKGMLAPKVREVALGEARSIAVFFHLEALEYVALFDVLELAQGDAALEALGNFLGIVLEALK